VEDDSVRIGIIHTARSYPDVEVGVRARLSRSIEAGGVWGRSVEVAEVVDDAGDPETALAAARRLVEDVGVFAVVLASTVPEPVVTDYLEASQTPFFGWGFAPGYCSPNRWGFGFSGCLVALSPDVDGMAVDMSGREVLESHLGATPAVGLVTTGDSAGDAAELMATRVWGENLVAVHRMDDAGSTGAVEQLVEELSQWVEGADPDVLMLSVGLDATVSIKSELTSRTTAMVVDDVSYFPGLLADVPTARKLEGGYVLVPLPPQEEYREVTGVIAADLERIEGPLVYSQAVTIGYWSADLMLTLLEAVGRDLHSASFSSVAHETGVEYAPGLVGGPCPISTLEIHSSPAGGAALLQVRGGIYRPVVGFRCPELGDS
jgi:hypothetical protein